MNSVDENLSRPVVKLFIVFGHDVLTDQDAGDF